MKKILNITLFLIAICVFNANGQQFGAGIAAGATASQINGDDSAGFNKLGLTGGLFVTSRISDNKELSLEFRYSQRGAQSKQLDGQVNDILINLQYVTIPLLFTIKDWHQDDDYYRMHFQGGVSYGNLLGASYHKNTEDIRAINLKKNDISLILGAAYYLNEHVGLQVRYNRSLTKLAKQGPVFRRDLYGYFLSFNILYKL